MPAAARFSRPNATTPDTTERTEYSFTQTLPHTDQWRYLRPTVMLIDERTLSQAEHTGLFLEAANRTKFIGSPTAGRQRRRHDGAASGRASDVRSAGTQSDMPTDGSFSALAYSRTYP